MNDQPKPTELRFAHFTLKPATGELCHGNASVRIADKPLAVLLMLLERPGELVTREELRERFWPHALTADFDNSLNAAVKRLRDVLGDDASEPRFVETLPRRGYRLISSDDEARAHSRPSSGLGRRAGLAAALLLALLVVGIGWQRRAPAPATPLPFSSIPRLAVLPLASHGHDTIDLAGGLTEELTSTLAMLAPERLAVIASTSARAADAGGGGIEAMRASLGATHVIEGGVRSEESRVKITLRLVESGSATLLWAHAYELEHPAGLALQEAVAARVAEALKLSVADLRPRLTSTEGVSDESIQDYWTAKRALGQTPTPEIIYEARDALDRAVGRDPQFAAAHAALADLYLLVLQSQPSDEAAERAETAAREAVRLDKDMAAGHAALAMVALNRWDFEQARRSIERSLSLDPGQASHHHWAALVHSARGEHHRAISAALRAESLDPLSYAVNVDLGWTYYYARQFEAAIAHEIEMRNKWPVAGPLPWFVPLALHLSDRSDEAVEALRRDLEQREIPVASRLRFDRASEQGIPGVARWARDVFARQAQTGIANTQMLARLHALLDERDEALEWLVAAVDTRAGWLAYLAVDPALDGLRRDPRFAEIASGMRARTDRPRSGGD